MSGFSSRMSWRRCLVYQENCQVIA